MLNEGFGWLVHKSAFHVGEEFEFRFFLLFIYFLKKFPLILAL